MTNNNNRDFYELKNMTVLFPDVWNIVQPWKIDLSITPFQAIKHLDTNIQILDITPDTINKLPKDSQDTYAQFKQLYDRSKKHWTTYQQPQSYQYQILPEFQHYLNQGYTYEQVLAYQQQYQQQQLQMQYQLYMQQQLAYQQPQAYYQQSQQSYQQPYQQYPQQQQTYNNNAPYQNYQYNQNRSNHHNKNYQNQPQYESNQQHNAPQNQNSNPNFNNQHRNQRREDQGQKYIAKSESISTSETQSQNVAPAVVESKTEKVEKVEEKKQEIIIQKKKLSIQEIKQLIASAVNKEELKKAANPQLVREIEQTKNWVKRVENVEAQPDRNDKKNYNKNDRNQKEFNKGSKYQPSKDQDFNRGSKINKLPTQTQSTFDIQIGKNENLQTKIYKTKLRQKAAEGDFAQKKAKEQESLTKIEQSKREIVFNLNRVAPENIKDIFSELIPFATEEQAVCIALVDLIIEKAWEQPKYAASYAKLCSYFAKLESDKFKFIEKKTDKNEKTDKKNQIFKFILLQKVQHSFDKKEKKQVPQDEDKDKFARETKNLIMGNVKFIGELIKIKLIPKKTMKYCLSQLLNNFLQGYLNFVKNNVIQNNFFDYYFQALLEFLENLGEKFEEVDGEEPAVSKLSEIQKTLKDICSFKKPYSEVSFQTNLSVNDYFKLFKIMNDLVLSKIKEGKRLAALLQNLQERREKGWKKHNVESEGPKKLKDLKYDQQFSSEQKQKVDLAQLEDKMSKLLKKWVEGDKKQGQQDLEGLGKKYRSEELFCAYVKQACNDKKDQISKRLQVFDIILDKYLELKNFKQAWTNAVSALALLKSEFPFSAAVMAKIWIAVDTKRPLKLSDYFIKFNEDDQEEEFYFMDEIFQKLFHYTQNQNIKDFIEPKNKLSHVL